MKLSIQTGDLTVQYGMEQGYRMIADAGFEAVDWNLDHALRFDDVKAAEKLEGLSIFEKGMDEILAFYAEELSIMKKNNLVITQAHAPFPPDLPGRPEVLDYSIALYDKMIRFCQIVGIPRLVIHGISKREPYPEISQEEIKGLNDKMYESLIPALQECPDVTVCVENLFAHLTQIGFGFWAGVCSDPHEAAVYIDVMNEKAGRDNAFGLCLDTGHLNIARIPFCRYIPILGKRIVCLHIHDNLQNDDAHLMPYTGSVRWEEFVDELHKIGYDGDLNFETFMQTKMCRLPAELCPQFLRIQWEIGDYFRKKIIG